MKAAKMGKSLNINEKVDGCGTLCKVVVKHFTVLWRVLRVFMLPWLSRNRDVTEDHHGGGQQCTSLLLLVFQNHQHRLCFALGTPVQSEIV